MWWALAGLAALLFARPKPPPGPWRLEGTVSRADGITAADLTPTALATNRRTYSYEETQAASTFNAIFSGVAAPSTQNTAPPVVTEKEARSTAKTTLTATASTSGAIFGPGGAVIGFVVGSQLGDIADTLGIEAAFDELAKLVPDWAEDAAGWLQNAAEDVADEVGKILPWNW